MKKLWGFLVLVIGCGGSPAAQTAESVTTGDGGTDAGRVCALLCWALTPTTVGYGCEPSGSAVTEVPFDAGCRVSATECTPVVEARCDGNAPHNICCLNDLTIP